jgi:outer membrane autotransporter protein
MLCNAGNAINPQPFQTMKKAFHFRIPPMFRLARAAVFAPPLLLPAVLLLFICRASGEQVLIEEDTTLSERTVLTSGVNLEYRVADGATLTFAGNSNDMGGSFNIEAATASLVIGPFGTTGRAVFSSMSAAAGGAIRQNGSFSLTNVDFIGNRSTAASGVASNGGGAIVMSSRSGTITGGTFTENRAANRGGAILMPASASLILNNVVFTDNWAGASGGAIHNGFGTGYVEINMTRDGDRDFYAFTGNIAGNINTAGTVTAEQVVNNTAPAPAANGAGGGFYHGGANGATLAFNIAEGVTLAIGDAAESNRNIDSIGGASGAIFTKNGAGDLILHANNQSMGGTFTLNAGRVLLGNTGAGFRNTGLRIVVNDGATLGGLGAIAATATFNSGGALQVGLDDDATAGTLSATGTLFFNNNSRLALDLFAGNQADRLDAAALNQTGTVTIDLGITTTGANFTLATWTGGGGLNLANLRLDADGARNSATLADLALSGNSLVLSSNTTYGLALHWTGSGDGVWRNGGANWSDGGAPGAGTEATHFLTGDSVTFGNDAAADKRVVRLAGTGAGGVVTASEMNVTAAGGAYVFTGSQGIRITGASALAESKITGSGTSGKLIKTGAGTLSFENTAGAGNLFEGGIEIGSASAAGGVIQFTDTKQLGTAAGGTISFVNSGTLRAMPGAGGTLAARIEISAGATAGFDVQGTTAPFRVDSVLAGAVSAGFIKTGAGTLVLGADNSASFGGAGVVAAGRLLLDVPAKLSGSLQVDGGAVFGGAGQANDVLLADGGGLRVGMPEAQTAGVLTLHKLTLAGGAVLDFSIISGDADPAASVGSRLEVDELELLAGAGDTGLVFDVSRLSDGNYNLAKFGAVTGDFTGLATVATVRENGRVLSDRETGTVSVSGGTLGLHMQNAQNEVITWTGGDVTWSAGKHWESGAAPISFARGDSVVFDGAADAARADDRNITIDATMITVTEMRVTGDANYRFNGGGIEVDATSQTGAEFTPDGGGFIKEGAGAVVFENAPNLFADGMRVEGGAVLFSNAANTIAGGIELRGGIVAFDRAAQIDTAGAAITFAGAGTGALQAMADIPDLPNTIVVEAGATGVLNTQNHRVSYSGTLRAPDASAVLAKLGTGRLTLAGGNAAFAGTTRVEAGALLLDGGVLGGKISVESGAVFGGAGHASGTVGVLAGGTVRAGVIGDGAGHLRMGNLVLNNDATLAGSGTLTVDGPVATDAAVALNVAGSDRLAFSGGISGAGVFEKRGAGIFELADGAVINADSVAVVEGELHLAGGTALRIARALTLESRTDLESTGKLKVLGDAAIELLPGAALTNRGAIYVGQAAGATNFKTLAVNGAYHGDGGAVVLRIGGAGSTAADKLQLNGAVSGTTWLKLDYVSVSGTANAPLTAAELQTIVLVGGGTFADGAVFQTGDSGALMVADDPYRWGYVKSATEHGWRTTLDPVVPALTGLDTTALLMGKASMDALSRRISAARGVEKTNHSGGIWVNALYRYDKIDTGLYQGARGTIKGLQAGGEWRGAGDAAGAVAGVFVDYINANMDQAGGASEADTESDGFGLYAGVTGGNWYAGAVFRQSRENYKVLVPGAPEFSTAGRSRAVSAELGYLISGRENVVPFVQAVWQDHDIEDASDSFGRAYRISGAGSLEVRAGARTVHEFSFWENCRGFLYARAAVLCESKAKSRVRVGDYIFDSDLAGVGGMVDMGMSLQFGKHMHIDLSGAAELCEQRKGCTGNLTIGYTW